MESVQPALAPDGLREARKRFPQALSTGRIGSIHGTAGRHQHAAFAGTRARRLRGDQVGDPSVERIGEADALHARHPMAARTTKPAYSTAVTGSDLYAYSPT